jgi:putative flippase GtrA
MKNRISQLIDRIPFHQLARFGAVGIFGTVTHFITVIALVNSLKIQPLDANVMAFLVAFMVSFTGHSQFTFGDIDFNYQSALRRFFAIQVGGFILNQVVFYILLTYFHWYYIPALILDLLIVPPIVFVSSRLWVFVHRT